MGFTDNALVSFAVSCEEVQWVMLISHVIFSGGQNLLPVGIHDKLGESSVKCFCPKCRDLYHPPMVRHRSIDGAAFGSSLPHLLLQRFPEMAPVKADNSYIPRIYGFRIHDSAPELRIHRSQSPIDKKKSH